MKKAATIKKSNSRMELKSKDAFPGPDYTPYPISQAELKKNKTTKKNASPFGQSPINSLLSGIFDNIGAGGVYGSNPLSLPFNMSMDNSYTPLTLNRILLSYTYMTHGLVQTVIGQPVDDAFRGGLDIKCDELDSDDIKELERHLDVMGDLKAIKATLKWARLFGGAGLIVNTDQDPATELDVDAIDEDSPLSFIDADRWELSLGSTNTLKEDAPFNYYGVKTHQSRVIKVMGREAPSFIRARLQGWGMSVLECMIRPLNSYLKNEDVIYELLSEAKIDVWKIQGYNASILKSSAQTKLGQRLAFTNVMKSFNSAITLDKEDDFVQRQISLSGLDTILQQNRIGAAAAAHMPMNKLFGQSAQGFGSGEDDIENYNAMIESEVRAPGRGLLREIISLRCKQIFGVIPESLEFEFKTLRVMSSIDEENVKNAKANRASAIFSQGCYTPQEYVKTLKQDGVITIETEVEDGADPVPPGAPATTSMPQAPVKSSRISEDA